MRISPNNMLFHKKPVPVHAYRLPNELDPAWDSPGFVSKVIRSAFNAEHEPTVMFQEVRRGEMGVLRLGSEFSTLPNGDPLQGTTVSTDAPPYLVVYTLEGNMRANPGDWVIRGVQGEFYPCKDNIFRETYGGDFNDWD